MVESRFGLDHKYRLVFVDRGKDGDQPLEFEATGADVALLRAQKHSRGRELEMFEDGRSLGRLHLHETGGYWVLTPPETLPERAHGTC